MCTDASGRDEHRILNGSPSDPFLWTLDHAQLNRKDEDVTLYIHFKTEKFENGELTTAFEYHPEKKAAFFGVEIDPSRDTQNMIPCFENIQKEYIILIDRSGSMHGGYMAQSCNIEYP